MQSCHRSIAGGFPLCVDFGLGDIRVVGGEADESGNQIGRHQAQPDPGQRRQRYKRRTQHKISEDYQTSQETCCGSEEIPAEGQANAQGIQHRVVPSLMLAVLIAFSRLYLYVHYPSDIFAGVIVGIMAGWFGTKLVDIIWRKLNAA